MEAILVQKVNTAPDAVAVVDSDRVVSYRELIAWADMVADQLDQQAFDPGTPVCIVANTGLHQVMAQVAVLRAGGSCVPVDPAAPEDRLKSILEDLNTKHIITDKDNIDRVQNRVPSSSNRCSKEKSTWTGRLRLLFAWIVQSHIAAISCSPRVPPADLSQSRSSAAVFFTLSIASPSGRCFPQTG